jgi:hypothetical protein
MVKFEESGTKKTSTAYKIGDFTTKEMDMFTDALRLLLAERAAGTTDRLPASARHLMDAEWLSVCGAPNHCLITNTGRLEKFSGAESPLHTHEKGMIYWKVRKSLDDIACSEIFTGVGVHIKFMTTATVYTQSAALAMAYFVVCAAKADPTLPLFIAKAPGDTFGKVAKPSPEHFKVFKDQVPQASIQA